MYCPALLQACHLTYFSHSNIVRICNCTSSRFTIMPFSFDCTQAWDDTMLVIFWVCVCWIFWQIMHLSDGNVCLYMKLETCTGRIFQSCSRPLLQDSVPFPQKCYLLPLPPAPFMFCPPSARKSSHKSINCFFFLYVHEIISSYLSPSHNLHIPASMLLINYLSKHQDSQTTVNLT